MIQPTLKRVSMPLERGFCGCGAPADPPLAGCQACYRAEQEAQRSRGRWRVGDIANAFTTNSPYRMARKDQR